MDPSSFHDVGEDTRALLVEPGIQGAVSVPIAREPKR